MIVFKNKGLIDPRAIKTFGVSSKECDSPIGSFGTGLKYSIAIILREGGSISIWRGNRELKFGLKKSKIRVDTFKIVTMGGQELGFTTDLGKGWETWQAFRELYCNAMDEGGNAYDTSDEVKGETGFTKVVVTGADFEKHFRERDKIILATERMMSLPGLDVHAGESDHIYYRGIRVMKLDQPSRYTYNITQTVTLTEDRTVKYPFMVPGIIAEAAVRSSAPAFIQDLLTADKSFESKVNWESANTVTPSDVFMTVAADLKAQRKIKAPGAVRLFNRYTDTISGYSNAHLVALTPVEAAVISRAKDKLRLRGIATDDFQIAVKNRLGGDLQVVTQGNTLTLSQHCLHQGDDVVARALLLGIARSFGGSVEDQLCNFVLDGEMRRFEQPATVRPELEDIPF